MIPIIGLMSGTSVDGIDASLVFTNGTKLDRTSFNSITPYREETQNFLKICNKNPKRFKEKKEQVARLTKLITNEHANVAKKLIKISGIKPELIGFHGQTIYHNPSNLVSIQLGDGKLLSKLLKTNVVFNFRSSDILNGGQGAPIAPIYHKYLIENLKIKLPAVIINIGGISNITYWDGENLLGFDTGPGNNLMDHYVQMILNKKFDKNGDLASLGTPNFAIVEEFLNQNYFNMVPPKSLDRTTFIKNNIYKKKF